MSRCPNSRCQIVPLLVEQLDLIRDLVELMSVGVDALALLPVDHRGALDAKRLLLYDRLSELTREGGPFGGHLLGVML